MTLSALPPIARAALWMIGTTLSLTCMAVAGRELSDTMGPFEVSFFRAFGGLLIILLLLWRFGFAQVRTQRLKLHVARNVFHFGGQTLWFWGLSLLPLATVFALEFTTPFWTGILATMFLAERMNRGRVTAVVLGFAGILIILQPGGGIADPKSLIVIAAAIGFAISNVCSKPLSATETPFTVIFYMNVIQTPLGLIASAPDWVWPAMNDLPWIVVVGLAGLSAHFCMTRAFRLADAMVILPIDYLRLPLAVAIGYFVYAQSVGWSLVVGAAIILAGNVYALRYEVRRRPVLDPAADKGIA
jgi:drug/metabolite transporter (DMT)-like permease